MRNKYFRFFIFTTTIILAAFLFAEKTFAETPKISSFFLNNKSENYTFNPNNNEEVDISINTNKPVKFNTVAICLVNDLICSRSTSIKYFFQYDNSSTSLSKKWNGKTKGKNPVIVGAGEYKVKATIKDELGEESNEFGQYSIFVDFSNNNFNNNQENATTTDNTETTSTTTNETSNSSTTNSNTSTQVVTRTVIRYVSVHSSSEDLSNYEENSTFEISAGRERLSYVGVPVKFLAKYKTSKNVNNNTCNFIWSFGDGTKGAGEEVSHIYKFSGDYSVVLNGFCGEKNSVSRTTVKVLVPELFVSFLMSGDVEISNLGKTEINLGDWRIRSSSGDFIFPEDTIISAEKKMILSKEYSKIFPDVNIGASVFDPSGSLIVKINTLLPKNDENLAKLSVNKSTSTVQSSNSISSIEITNEEAQNFINEFKKLTNQTKNAKKELSFTYASSSVLEATPPNEPSKVATVAEISSSTEGFLKKMFNLPIEGIKSLVKIFYDVE